MRLSVPVRMGFGALYASEQCAPCISLKKSFVGAAGRLPKHTVAAA